MYKKSEQSKPGRWHLSLLSISHKGRYKHLSASEHQVSKYIQLSGMGGAGLTFLILITEYLKKK